MPKPTPRTAARTAAKPNWVVTLSGDRPAAEVVAALKKGGFSVGELLAEIGVITGSAAAAKVDALRALPGVADIAADRAIDIGPPDSPNGW